MKDYSQSIRHERIAAVLGRLFRDRQMGHAYLFSGPRYSGKHTVMQALLEELPPKEIVHVERRIEEDGKRAEFIGIDQIRDVTHTLSLSLQNQDSYRIVLIHDAESVTEEAGNALLKSLEEPPERTIFILFEHFFGRILSTLQSRCAYIRFPLASDAHIREIVKDDDDAVYFSAGRPGTARVLLSSDALASLKERVAIANHLGEWRNFSKEQNEMKYTKEDGDAFELALHRQIQEGGDCEVYSRIAARYDAFQKIRMYAGAHVYQPGLIEACV